MNNIETVVLDNGLKIYLYKDSRRHTTFFQFITLFGGMHKDFKVDGIEYHFGDGIAHILEHYIVECNDVGNFLKKLGKMQMSTNASTHYNMTRFYFEAVENINVGIRTMLEGINNIRFDDLKLEKLKNPIYQEIRGRQNNRFYHSNIMTINNLFKKIKFRNVGGTLEEVKGVTTNDLKVCYEAFYQPSNQMIVIAGNFNRDEVLNEIYKFYDNCSCKKKHVEMIDMKEDLKIKKKEDILIFPTPLSYLEISFKIDVSKYNSKELLDLDFYLGCFYNHFYGKTSLLHKDLIDKGIITSGIGCSDSRIDKFMVISIGAYTKDLDYFKKIIIEAVENLCYFDQEKFELDKNSSILRMILRDESIGKMIMPFVDNVVNFNYPYLDTVKDIEDLKYDDYVKAIKNLDFSHYTVTIIKDKINEKV